MDRLSNITQIVTETFCSFTLDSGVSATELKRFIINNSCNWVINSCVHKFQISISIIIIIFK